MGKLNILHHKEWHVYSKANRDIVVEDERKEKEKNEKQKQRQRKVEGERRLETLRNKSNQNTSKSINFFEEEERLQGSELVKSERELAQKAYEDKHTVFLGETRDGKKHSPWYTERNYGRVKGKKEKDLIKDDPLPPKPKSKIGKKQKPVTIEELRQERLDRERLEAARLQKLLNTTDNRHTADRKYYHSQYTRKIYSLFEVNSIKSCLVNYNYQSEGLSKATDCFRALIASSFPS